MSIRNHHARTCCMSYSIANVSSKRMLYERVVGDVAGEMYQNGE